MYGLKAGDNLWNLSRKYDVPLESLIDQLPPEMRNEHNLARLQIGQQFDLSHSEKYQQEQAGFEKQKQNAMFAAKVKAAKDQFVNRPALESEEVSWKDKSIPERLISGLSDPNAWAEAATIAAGFYPLARAGAAIGGLGRVGELERMGQTAVKYIDDPMLVAENIGRGIENTVAPIYNGVKNVVKPIYNDVKEGMRQRSEDNYVARKIDELLPDRNKGRFNEYDHQHLLPGQRAVQYRLDRESVPEHRPLLTKQDAIRREIQSGKTFKDPKIPSTIKPHPDRASNVPSTVKPNPDRASNAATSIGPNMGRASKTPTLIKPNTARTSNRYN